MMNSLAIINKPFLTQPITVYRIIVGIGFVIAIALVLAAPVQMPDPDGLGLLFGVHNFSQGQFTIDNRTQNMQAVETARQGKLLIIGIPGFAVVLFHKLAACFKRYRPPEKWLSLRSELSWNILFILIAWFGFVFFLYLTYEWTAGIRKGGAGTFQPEEQDLFPVNK